MTHSKPIQQADRIQSLDVIRGFALIGILLSNMSGFKSLVFHDLSLPTWSPHPLDAFGQLVLELFVTAKFYPLFSILFGIGFYLFYSRLSERNLNGKALFKRRMATLLCIGLVHLIFIWSGDILHTYAIAGFILLLFRRKSSEQLLRWGILLIIFTGVGTALLGVAAAYANTDVGSGSLLPIMQLFQTGSYGEILSFRWQSEAVLLLFSLPFTLPNVLGLFLIGMAFGKMNAFKNVEKYKTMWRRLAIHGGWIGLFFSLLFVSLRHDWLPIPAHLGYALSDAVNLIGGPILTVSYIAVFVLLLQKEGWQRRVTALSALGRMALTNYLAQSLICVFMFYGFGFGLFGQVSVVQGMLIAVVIILVQMLLSSLWLRHAEQGPVEWIWRKLIYGKKSL
ncbi:DUF418 domain-containing protein [Aureibacillus halotolerans]|uniref:DUF418 domain-containing protein n=1 Tax=Aureibacillus halotolerans TaxID=1508390 RepID=A0A4R6TUM1_9BACI|nr:DUF418 domain-containing protein [Aureibacillus halotolerans]TDQ37440.1 uncharacterized protein EV213_11375 [Aureibacillus halotolerans]